MTYLHDDGTLVLAEWGKAVRACSDVVRVDLGPRPVPMYGTKATGERMVSNGFLGVDLIRVPAGEGFAPHTHPGDHLLIVVAGEGTISYDGRIYPTRAGQVYMVEGAIPHAVGATTDHCILAVGAPHRDVDAADRMALTEYAAVAADLGRMHCLACDLHGTGAELRRHGCPHAPQEAGEGLPLVVGLAPASEAHEGRRAFEDTRSGASLARLLDVEPAALFSAVETVNLSHLYLREWSKVPSHEWHLLADRLIDGLSGRVVVACGRTVCEALGGMPDVPWSSAQVIATTGEPALLVLIPHPSGLNRTLNDPTERARAARALAIARTMARTGSSRGKWCDADALAFTAAAHEPNPRN